MPIDVSSPLAPLAGGPLAILRAGLTTAAPAIVAALLASGCATSDDKAPDAPDDGADPSDSADPGDGDAPGGAEDTAPGETDTADPGDAGDTAEPGDTAPEDSDTASPGDSDTSADPAADWPCASWAEPVELGAVADSALDEISGIAPSRANPGVLWVLEDSGGASVLYALDATGASLGALTVTGVTNRDWEGLAVAPCPEGEGDCLWVGDTGDNGLSRSDVAVHVVREPIVTDTSFDLSADPTTYRYTFPDGRGNVEGFAVGTDGLPILVTKRVDGTGDMYRFPSLDADRTVTVEHVARISTGDANDEHPAEVTAADISPDGSRLLVRTYGFLYEYTLTDGIPGDRVSLPAPDEPQGEAVAYDAARRGVWITSEGSRQPLWFVACQDG